MRKEEKSNNVNYENIVKVIIYPKALTLEKLFGGFDEASGEWIDGLIGKKKIKVIYIN